MTCDERKFLLQELQAAREFVGQHWTDDLGGQFTAWVCQTEEELTKLEQQNELCTTQADAILRWCQQVLQNLDENPNDPPKVLKLEHTPPLHR